ncbi:MAG: metallophosphoesterase [Clostridiales bacterium]|nr:metallophosphoesterase [Clostridiales bacterium]
MIGGSDSVSENINENSVLRFDPAVFVVGSGYQIIFLTSAMGIGWVEIGGDRFTDEECGLLMYDTVHKIPVPGAALNSAREYTVVFVEYADKKPYYPVGVEKVRKTYSFKPLEEGADRFRIFQFADTHAQTDLPLETYDRCTGGGPGGCDLLLLNGDINEWSDKISHFDTSFKLAAGAVRGERPVIYSRGNHDTRGHCAHLLAGYIPTACREGRRETFYSFRQGSLWGLVLDCGEDKYDHNIEYGGTISFNTFRDRETAYLESLIADAEHEYSAPGVKYRIAFCHLPITERFDHPFDVASDIYDRWTELLGQMGINLLVSGHMHRAYHIAPRFAPDGDGIYKGKGLADFPTAVLSCPKVELEDGSYVYLGGIVEAEGGKVTSRAAM